MVNSLSKYQNQIQGSTTVSPAKFGKLTLEEYDSNGNLVSDNNSETLDLADISSINKRVELKYTKGDIKSYIFFIVDAQGWQYDNNQKQLAIRGSSSDLVYISINDNWNYLEVPNQSASKFVFYHLVDIDERFEDEVISAINVLTTAGESLNTAASNSRIYGSEESENTSAGIPIPFIWPLCMTMTRSETIFATDKSCVMKRIDNP